MTKASAAAAVALSATEHLVGGQAQQPGRHLGQRQLLAVAAFPQVGGKDITLVAQRWRKTFSLGAAWLAVEDQRDQRPVGMALAKQAHLVVDWPAASG